MGENGGTFELQRLRGAGRVRGGMEAVRVVQGAVLQAPQPTPTLNQSAAAATAAAILSMALAANMKYHTAKPFSMNIKFRLTISISCTNVSVTKFALGLGQRGQDSGTGRRPDRQTTGTARETEWSEGGKKSIQLPKYANAKACPIFRCPNICGHNCCSLGSTWFGLELHICGFGLD